MKNVPTRIWLNVGNVKSNIDFEDLSEVTWSQEQIHENDIPYVLDKTVQKRPDSKFHESDIVCLKDVPEFSYRVLDTRYIKNRWYIKIDYNGGWLDEDDFEYCEFKIGQQVFFKRFPDKIYLITDKFNNGTYCLDDIYDVKRDEIQLFVTL